MDRRHILALGGIERAADTRLEQLAHGQDAGEGRAQLMADRGDKGVLARIGAVQLGDGGFEVGGAGGYLLFEPGVGLLELLLGHLAVGDVGIGADHAQRFAVPIPGDGLADAAVPADLATLGYNAVFEAVLSSAALQVVVDKAPAGGSVVRVDNAEPELCGGLDLAGRIAQLGIPMIVDDDVTGGYIGVPEPFVGGIHGIAQAFLAGVEGGLEAVAFVDVAPDGQALAAAQLRDRHLYGQERAVAAAQVLLEGGPAGSVKAAADGVPVFQRIIRKHVFDLSADDLGAGAAEHGAGGGVDVDKVALGVGHGDAVAGPAEEHAVFLLAVAQPLVEEGKADAAGEKDKNGDRAARFGQLPGQLRRQKEVPGQEGRNQGGADAAGQAADEGGKEGNRVEEKPAGGADLRPEEPLQQADGEGQEPGQGDTDTAFVEEGCRVGQGCR